MQIGEGAKKDAKNFFKGVEKYGKMLYYIVNNKFTGKENDYEA